MFFHPTYPMNNGQKLFCQVPYWSKCTLYLIKQNICQKLFGKGRLVELGQRLERFAAYMVLLWQQNTWRCEWLLFTLVIRVGPDTETCKSRQHPAMHVAFIFFAWDPSAHDVLWLDAESPHHITFMVWGYPWHPHIWHDCHVHVLSSHRHVSSLQTVCRYEYFPAHPANISHIAATQ